MNNCTVIRSMLSPQQTMKQAAFLHHKLVMLGEIKQLSIILMFCLATKDKQDYWKKQKKQSHVVTFL